MRCNLRWGINLPVIKNGIFWQVPTATATSQEFQGFLGHLIIGSCQANQRLVMVMKENSWIHPAVDMPDKIPKNEMSGTFSVPRNPREEIKGLPGSIRCTSIYFLLATARKRPEVPLKSVKIKLVNLTRKNRLTLTLSY